MSITRSDNRFETHPKPVQEFERKLSGGAYVDWADTAEMEAVVNVNFRKNKYFWIAGTYQHCDSDGVTYRNISSGGAGTGGIYGGSGTLTANPTTVTMAGKTLRFRDDAEGFSFQFDKSNFSFSINRPPLGTNIFSAVNDGASTLQTDISSGLASNASKSRILLNGATGLTTITGNSLRITNNNGSSFYDFPVVDGASGQVLQTNGAGVVSWANVSGSIDWTAGYPTYDARYARKAGTLTQGSVVFVDSGGNLAQDNANFFWDNTNKRLGIGTNAPTTPFMISGTYSSGIIANLVPTQAGTGAILRTLGLGGTISPGAAAATASSIRTGATLDNSSFNVTLFGGIISTLTVGSTYTGATVTALTDYVSQSGANNSAATITERIGFSCNPLTIGATNIGFKSQVASGTNRWNFYAEGTASNYYNGNVLIGSSTDGGEKLQVTGSARFNGNLGFFNKTPIAQQTGGATTAGATYTATEQGMLQRMYDALRAYGLLT